MVQSEHPTVVMTSVAQAFAAIEAYGHEGTHPPTVYYREHATEAGVWYVSSDRWEMDGREPLVLDLRGAGARRELSA